MDFDMASEVFSALGDPHRLKALHFLATATPDCCQGPDGVCACDLVTHLGLAQPTVSHHMRLLTQAGLVTATKRGRWVHYALSAEGIQTVQTLLGQLRSQAEPPVPRTPPTPLSSPRSLT
jgi:ArsR family transcriptional regulator, arsenate/arsenite/antimonite-responsive transcriptional repressor